MTSRKAGAGIIAWSLGFIASVILAPFYPIFGGVAAGALLTALTLAFVVKWSLEGLMDDTMSNIEQMQEKIDENAGHGVIDTDEL